MAIETSNRTRPAWGAVASIAAGTIGLGALPSCEKESAPAAQRDSGLVLPPAPGAKISGAVESSPMVLEKLPPPSAEAQASRTCERRAHGVALRCATNRSRWSRFATPSRPSPKGYGEARGSGAPKSLCTKPRSLLQQVGRTQVSRAPNFIREWEALRPKLFNKENYCCVVALRLSPFLSLAPGMHVSAVA